MERLHQFGKTLLLYVGSFSILALTLCACLLILQGREAIVSVERSSVSLVHHADETLTAISAPCPSDDIESGSTSCGLVQQAGTAINTLNTTIGSANVLVRDATGSVRRFNISLDAVNHPCVPGPCGTLGDVAKTLNTVRGTAGEIEIAAHHEDKNLLTLDSQEVALFNDFHATFNNANALLTSPDVKSTLTDLSSTSKSVADGTKQADATITDVRTLADKYTHPSKKKLTFWTATEAVGDYVRHFMPPIF